ncbi:protein Star-like [Macrobrachium rosenbergii]|uniref:protein Star-like n=1 Tax=Macrobrachium rosenbergii TaxID=79674 RepID=UPI0034D5A270
MSSQATKFFIGFATATVFMALYGFYENGTYFRRYMMAQDDNDVSTQAKTPNPSPVISYDALVGQPMDSPKLIDYIRKEMLQPPSKGPYNLTEPGKRHFSQYEQGQIIENKIYKGKRNGFFLEVGAVDGETFSNSLYFERELGWTGLLIEANPATYKYLHGKGRKAYSVNCGLSLSQVPSKMDLMVAGPSGMLSKIKTGKGPDSTVTIKTIPLYSLLLALNVSVIDYLSLDIEGSEMKVLQTVPWDKVRIHVMDVESDKIPEGRDYLIRYMEDRGYKYLGTRTIDAFFVSSEVWNNVLKKVNPL